MKVVAFNGSPRKKGNTAFLLQTVMDLMREQGVETEIVQVGGKPIRGCTACYHCFESKDLHCAVDSDILNSCLDRMLSADGILLGSPTYFSCMSSEMKALIDRVGLVSLANGRPLRRKVGAAVVAARRAGAVHTFDSINHFFTINEMIVPGANYWNIGFGRGEGEVQGDDEGLATMKTLAENMFWLLQKLD